MFSGMPIWIPLVAGGLVALGIAFKIADGISDLIGPRRTRLSTRNDRGHSTRYQLHLQSAAWATTRRRILKRAGHRCEACRQRRPLQVHHLTYQRLGAELDADLMALCSSCHQAQHPTHAIGTATRAKGCPLALLSLLVAVSLVGIGVNVLRHLA
jgi:hypothetical protein